MILTKQELIAGLNKEVGILLHLAGKLEGDQIEYRPTAKQRSSLELLRYLSFMGPVLISAAKTGAFNRDEWTAEVSAAEKRNFQETIAAIEKLPQRYERLLSDMSDNDFRGEMVGFDGNTISKGMFIVNLVLGGHTAYRTQLFLYLKSCGHHQLGTTNLWRGADAMAPA